MIAGGRTRRRCAWIGIPILLLLSAAGCGSRSPEPHEQPAAAGTPTQEFRNLVLRETTDGRLEWVLRAQRAWRPGSGSLTRLAGLKIDFYQGREEIRSILTADSGSVDSQEGRLMARGNVVVETPDGDRLLTEELYWDRKNARVSSDVEVRLTRGRDTLTGVGFESDPNLERFELRREVRASVREVEGVRDGLIGSDGDRANP